MTTKCCEDCTYADEQEKQMLNDDRVLDARDMAAEIAEAKLPTYNDDHCAEHSAYDSNCGECFQAWIANAAARSIAEEVLDDVDAVIEQVARPRSFEDVINQWTDEVLAENRKASEPDTIMVIMRLGVLGQRLIYEANDVGMRAVMTATREVLSGGNN